MNNDGMIMRMTEHESKKVVELPKRQNVKETICYEKSQIANVTKLQKQEKSEAYLTRMTSYLYKHLWLGRTRVTKPTAQMTK